MNEFDYILKIDTMNKLKTKTAKVAFIREVTSELRQYNSTYYTLKLAQDIHTKFVLEGIPGTKNLLSNISVALGSLCWNNLRTTNTIDIDPKIFELKLPIETSLPYNSSSEFFRTSGVPAYLKLAMLKAKYDAEQRG